MIRNWTLVSVFAALALCSWAQPPGAPTGAQPDTVQNIPSGTPERGNTPSGLDPRQVPDSPPVRGAPLTPAARDQLVRPGQSSPVPVQTGEGEPQQRRQRTTPTAQPPTGQGQRPQGPQGSPAAQPQGQRPQNQQQPPSSGAPGETPSSLLQATDRLPGMDGDARRQNSQRPQSQQRRDSDRTSANRPQATEVTPVADSTPAQRTPERTTPDQTPRAAGTPTSGETPQARQTPVTGATPGAEGTPRRPDVSSPEPADSSPRTLPATDDQAERPRPAVSPDATPFVLSDMPEHLQRNRTTPTSRPDASETPDTTPTPVTGEPVRESQSQAPEASETPSADDVPPRTIETPSTTPGTRETPVMGESTPAATDSDQAPRTTGTSPSDETPGTRQAPPVGQTPPASAGTPRPAGTPGARPDSTPGTAPDRTPTTATPPAGETPRATGTPGAAASPSPAAPGSSPTPGTVSVEPAATPMTDAGRRVQEQRRRRPAVSADEVKPEDLNPAAAALLGKVPEGSPRPADQPDSVPPRPELTPYVAPQVVTSAQEVEQATGEAPVLVMPPPGATPTPTPAPERIIVNDPSALQERMRQLSLAPPPAPTPGPTPPPVPPGVTPVPRDFRPDRSWVPYPGWRPPNNWSPPRGWVPPGGWSPPPGWNPPREWVPRLRHWGWNYIPRRGWVVPVQWTPPPDFVVPPGWYYLPPAAYDDYGFYNPAEIVVVAGRGRPDLQVNINVTEIYNPPPPPQVEVMMAVPPPPRPAPPEPPPMPEQITSVHTVAQVLTRPRDPNGPRYQGPVLVAESVHFDFDSYAIKPESFPTLDAIGQALVSEIPDAILNVEGHTDSDGSDEYNQTLSEQRAWSVKSYLVQKFGIDPNRLIIVGYGERAPIASNASEQGKALNRRVEFENVTDLYQAQVLETAQPE